ncbi:MAG TPA: aldolase/citrate lyase family protein, partial [Deinococcales bacterium]|nr:aldolase/citrate lyase family protein [Deinococcales bacterium]
MSLAAMLFIPGGDERKLEKIESLPARSFLLDLEDGVAPSAKADARRLVPAAMERYAPGRRLWVRVNAADSGLLLDDLEAVVVPGVEGVNLPKAQGHFD